MNYINYKIIISILFYVYKKFISFRKELESFKRSKLITDSEEQNHHSNKKIPINFFINQNHSSNLDELENLSQLDITSSGFYS